MPRVRRRARCGVGRPRPHPRPDAAPEPGTVRPEQQSVAVSARPAWPQAFRGATPVGGQHWCTCRSRPRTGHGQVGSAVRTRCSRSAAGARRTQGRRAASRAGASPALRADRTRRGDQARARWTPRVLALGFADLDDYLAARLDESATAHRVRTELGCGGSVAARLLADAADRRVSNGVSTGINKPAHATGPVGSVT